jgi:DNA-binding NtrC family response regulator
MAKMAIVTTGSQSDQDLFEALTAAGHEVSTAPAMSAVSRGSSDGDGGGSLGVVFASASAFASGPAAPADVPVIITAEGGQIADAIDAVRRGGAYDLLRLPTSPDQIELTAWRALRCQQIMRENAVLRAQTGQEPAADPLASAARNLAGKPLADIEKQVILRTLEQFKGHRLRTASALGIGVRTLGMKIKRWREEGEPIAGRQPRPHVHVDVS